MVPLYERLRPTVQIGRWVSATALILLAIGCQSIVAETFLESLLNPPGSAAVPPAPAPVVATAAPSPTIVVKELSRSSEPGYAPKFGSAIQLNPSVMVVGAYDWQPRPDGSSRCTEMVDRAARMGGDRINWFTTHYWWVTGNERGIIRSDLGHCKPYIRMYASSGLPTNRIFKRMLNHLQVNLQLQTCGRLADLQNFPAALCAALS